MEAITLTAPECPNGQWRILLIKTAPPPQQGRSVPRLFQRLNTTRPLRHSRAPIGFAAQIVTDARKCGSQILPRAYPRIGLGHSLHYNLCNRSGHGPAAHATGNLQEKDAKLEMFLSPCSRRRCCTSGDAVPAVVSVINLKSHRPYLHPRNRCRCQRTERPTQWSSLQLEQVASHGCSVWSRR